MANQSSQHLTTLVQKYRDVESPLRLATGLILFAYAAGHFLTHASGTVLTIEGMEDVSEVLLAPWDNRLGQLVLYFSFVVHAAYGLVALARRRTLQMPAKEAIQLALGLLIPLLLIEHVVNVRLAEILYEFDNSYLRLIHHYFVEAPLDGAGQLLLLTIVWFHGCLGLHFFLRFRPGYAKVKTGLLLIAIFVPLMAFLGLYDAGFEADEVVQANPMRVAPPSAIDVVAAESKLDLVSTSTTIGYLALVAGVFLFRTVRSSHSMRYGAVRISYPDGTTVVVPRGFSILEASRFARMPHASVCGGRARCSTCRVRILQGSENLPPPAAQEAHTLSRIGADSNVRLACQIRPQSDLVVAPILGESRDVLVGNQGSYEFAQEREICALFIDLRDSTKLAENRLPFDILFVIDQYVRAVTRAIEGFDGKVISISGDGVMAVFGTTDPPETACRNALLASAKICRSIEKLNRTLKSNLEAPLRFGIGLHAGVAVVGNLQSAGNFNFQFIGDVGNVASRLESSTKELGGKVIASSRVAQCAGYKVDENQTRELQLRGRQGPITIAIIDDPALIESQL